jgi:hypothetical protein
VARYAHACNLFASSPEDIAHKLDVLRAHCDAEGHDYDAIRKTAVYAGLVLDAPAAFVADAKRYAGLGISQLDVTPDRDPVEYTERLATIVLRILIDPACKNATAQLCRLWRHDNAGDFRAGRFWRRSR